ncbi:hypothetical protein LBMAG07_14390 [Actinomycetes bacterium]|jgi:hypothetical protein|nr:hypothetical protein LBMAG07_14390 [Actinomycetes bacterium]
MLCSNGHQNAAEAKFCRDCGQVLASGGSPGAGYQQATQAPQVQATTSKLSADLKNDLLKHRHESPEVNLQTIITVISGALFALAVLLLAFDAVGSSYSDSPFLIGFVWTAIGCAVVYLLTKFASSDLIPGATTAVVPLLGLSVLFLFGNSIDDGEVGLPLIVLGLAYAAAWSLPILRGRPALLVAGLLSLGNGLVVLNAQSSIRGYSVFDDPTDFFDSATRESSSLYLIIGIVLLAIGWSLDRKDWPSFGKVFIGVGIVFEVSGAFGVLGSSEDRTAASILLTAAGALLIIVAVQRSRKTSLVIGGFGAFAGIVAFIVALTESSDGIGLPVAILLGTSFGFGFIGVKKSLEIQNKIRAVGKP